MAYTQWFNGVVGYFWPQSKVTIPKEQQQTQEMPHLSRLKRLRTLLQDSNYQQLHRQQLCLFYSNLIKQYKTSKSTFQYPKLFYEPDIYTMKVFFIIPLVINTQHIKGVLQLFVMFHQQMDQEMPTFLIQNPDYQKFKPNKKCVWYGQEGKEGSRAFEAIMGGLKVQLPKTSKQRWQWTPSSYYRETNIVNMVRYIHKQLVMDCFPFVFRKIDKMNSVQKQARSLKNLFDCWLSSDIHNIPPLLQNLQKLHSLSAALDIKIDQIFSQNTHLKQQEYTLSKQDIQQYLPVISDKRSQNLIDAISSLEAYKDSVSLLEQLFSQEELTFNQFQKQAQKLFGEEFQQRQRIRFWQSPQLLSDQY